MFREEVQKQFIKAGWHEGRSVPRQFDKAKGFEHYPQFLKDFLYEYANLEVYTLDGAWLDFKAVAKGRYNITDYLKNPRYYGNTYTYPIAFYQNDNATLECDAYGRVYMSGEYSLLISGDFKTGIEKVIMEDYTGVKEWDMEEKTWVDL